MWQNTKNINNNQNKKSTINNDNKPIKIKIPNQNIQNAIECRYSWGPIFGVGTLKRILENDFVISSNSNTNADSHSYLGSAYPHPNYQKNSTVFKCFKFKCFLAGSFKFSTSEIEVFQVI